MKLLKELLEMKKQKKVIKNPVAKNSPSSGTGFHVIKQGKHAPRNKQKEQVKKEIKDSLKEGANPTSLTVDQMREIVSYMRELIDREFAKSAEDAAGLALEDVAGFETANERKIQSTINRLTAMYIKTYS